MLDQLPMEYFQTSGSPTVDPPIPLADANGNHGIYFQQRIVEYRVKCGTAKSIFDVIEKKWTGLPLLCACRHSREVMVAVPLCMWGTIDRQRVREAFRSALLTSAIREATKCCMHGQPFIRGIVSRILLWVSECTDAKWLQIEEERKVILDEIESLDFDTQLWRNAGWTWTQATKPKLVFEIKGPVWFKWKYEVTADDIELDAEELRQKIIDNLELHGPAYLMLT